MILRKSTSCPQQFREPGARAMPPLTEEGERLRAESDLVLH